MNKLNLMENKYSMILKKYEDQLKINEDFKKEVVFIKNQLKTAQSQNAAHKLTRAQDELENNVIISGMSNTKGKTNLQLVKKSCC